MSFQTSLRRLSTMSTMSNPKPPVSPFSKAVVGAMRKLYPEQLADSSFDNTGLLLEAPYRRDNYLRNSALLTIDLTQAVADEAIARRDSIIVTYHPIIFRALKSLTQANTQQHTLLRLAQEGISVYSPHTAVDAAPGGLNDWLVDCLTVQVNAKNEGDDTVEYTASAITPAQNPPPGFEDAGYGRFLRFAEPQDLRTLIQRACDNLRIDNMAGHMKGLSVATPQSVPIGSKGDIKISTVGICAGSGGSMLNGLDVDLLFTGELSHHEALSATEQGRSVITVFHSNSERGFLHLQMKDLLTEQVEKEIAGLASEGLWAEGFNKSFEIGVSAVDRDPFEIKMLDDLEDW